jgi:hypothetical protein
LGSIALPFRPARHGWAIGENQRKEQQSTAMFGIQFKHLVYLAALFCAGWALTVSALVAYEEIGYFAYPSELPRAEGSLRINALDLFDKFAAVSQTMNVILPIGVACIAFLIYTYSLNPIGAGSLTVAVAALIFAVFRLLNAVAKIEDGANTDIATAVWWMQ